MARWLSSLPAADSSRHRLGRLRIQRSQQANARLEERLRELTIVEDRDRLAAGLQSSVVQRIFAAGLKLQGALPLATGAEVRHRIESLVTDLDDAIRLLRQAIFGLERRLDAGGLRQQVLHLCRPVAGARDHLHRTGR
jgi:two-component system, NarL family, sensor histidine kinase DevS